MITWPAKDPDETLDYSWQPDLDEGDAIATFSAVPVAGSVTIDSSEHDAAVATIWLSGGATGETAEFTLTVTTAGGRVFEETARLPVLSSSESVVSLALAKQHLRVRHDDEDLLIEREIAAAIAAVENATGKKLTRQTVSQDMPRFSPFLPLAWGPAPSNVSVSYIDVDLVAQTVSDIVVNGQQVWPDSAWPTTADHTAITLSYEAGYAQAPAELVSAVLRMLTHLHFARDGAAESAALPRGVEALCLPYRRVLV